MHPPFLPRAPSWYPGHMSRFTRLLPSYLARTDIVLELRDARLPLTSVNPAFERIITKWQMERKKMAMAMAIRDHGDGAQTAANDMLCERVIVLGKKDLVGQWGIDPFRKAMLKTFTEQQLLEHQHVHFTCHMQPPSIKELSQLLISLAKTKVKASNDAEYNEGINVLVVGMPNVGKSTLLNSLRNVGIAGRTPKALKTGAHPGLTRALSTRLKLSVDPLIYAFDTPGVMVPFMGRGDRGAERGVKLALIAGIKEGLYDVEALASYLVYRLWVLNPQHPAYMTLLPPPTKSQARDDGHEEYYPTDAIEFLERLASRLGMIQRGGELDLRRAAVWFIKWWREEGGLVGINHKSLSPPSGDSASSGASQRMGWGFDFEWDRDWDVNNKNNGGFSKELIQKKMEGIIAEYLKKTKEEENSPESMSSTQVKKKMKQEKIARRLANRTRT